MVKMTYYTVIYDEPSICDHGYMHFMPVVVTNIKTLDQAVALASKMDGTIEEVEEEIEIKQVLVA